MTAENDELRAGAPVPDPPSDELSATIRRESIAARSAFVRVCGVVDRQAVAASAFDDLAHAIERLAALADRAAVPPVPEPDAAPPTWTELGGVWDARSGRWRWYEDGRTVATAAYLDDIARWQIVFFGHNPPPPFRAPFEVDARRFVAGCHAAAPSPVPTSPETPTWVDCAACSGSGFVFGSEADPCPSCDGLGRVDPTKRPDIRALLRAELRRSLTNSVPPERLDAVVADLEALAVEHGHRIAVEHARRLAASVPPSDEETGNA